MMDRANDLDRISLSGLQFYAYHGVFPEENKLGQRFVVDLELYLPLDKAGRSDRLQDTVNYAEVCALVRDIAEQRTFQLVEALAECIASEVLQTYTIINALTVRVVKPHPPVPLPFDGVTVQIHRKRA